MTKPEIEEIHKDEVEEAAAVDQVGNYTFSQKSCEELFAIISFSETEAHSNNQQS